MFPLPGLSFETYEDAERILKGLQHQMIGFSAEENFNSVAELLLEFHLVPSLQFALEQAIIELMIKRNRNFIKDIFVNVKSEFEVNAVIAFGEEEDILNRINGKIKKVTAHSRSKLEGMISIWILDSFKVCVRNMATVLKYVWTPIGNGVLKMQNLI